MGNLYPFANHMAAFNHMRGMSARQYIRVNFNKRNDCSTSAAYNRACIRDAIAAIRCTLAMGV